ncbi:type II CRISPR RNA-guided endonuclease Cas9 [Pseudodesulfovibrio thermohalotolerans]|uniref:type II CRISPR RNA-guided endonuclease Cas9 n=1 Tax=Pseudodesulfovibrio thermohalotolerans TaxID=2880651 RepID=UPI0024430BD7|nr:type II CRISPR RNA-guided endonuclease Cas9 [Pseudodesulfovibrio thermohalotolerans]WFS63048.1 type II CRISPR RNA-guided endonuclease Cas9 [Pseudodesulfovibrio thermohalotolerans]
MWRLGLDIGSNSIGWAVLCLEDLGHGYEPYKIIDMGVRIFPDGREPAGTDRKTGLPKIGESLAVTRRMARGMRRNRDRRLKRIRVFADRLVEFGLIPQKGVAGRNEYKTGRMDMSIDPYEARAKAAVGIVSKNELARALLHLCKRRGFLSNRKTDGEDKEASERKGAMQGLTAILEERELTLGQYLRDRIAFDKHVRFRGAEFDDTAGTVAIYPTRAMYADEFNAIRKKQGTTHLTDEQWDELFDIFSFQRPLLPKEPGACSFEHGRDGREEHPRAWRHLPISHTFRILQEVNNLRFQAEEGDRELSQEHRASLVEALEHQKSMSFSKVRSLLNLPRTSSFNLESERRKKLDGNATGCDMRVLFTTHGCDWDNLGSSVQNDVVQMIHDARGLAEFMAANCERHWDLPGGLIRDLSKKYYPSSHGHISRRCMEKLLPYMRDGMQYWEAAREVYGDHTDYSQFSTGEVLEELPYYGEVLRGATVPVAVTPNTPEEEANYGKIPNPTVHVALNQLRKLINTLVKRYGSPYDIHLELARNVKKAGKNYQELLKGLADNTGKNEKRRKQYEECFPGQIPSGLDMIKMRLWEELAEDDTDDGRQAMARMDIYTGRTIGFRQLFSDEVEIEHILPYGRTYDNSIANRTVTFRDVNRRKGGDKLPYQFAQGDSEIDAEAMRARAKRLPRAKRWRFGPDAAEVYEQILTKSMTLEERREYDADSSGTFIDRQLVDTQYISRIAARYLSPVVGEPSRVVPVNGHVTNLIRNKWQINAIKAKGKDEERRDHRHHAEDALIVALADRSLVKRIADKTREEQEGRKDYKAKLRFPERPAWATDARIKEVAEKINVSFRQDHSRESKLYQETAYGLLDKNDRWHKQGFHGVVRRPVTSLKEKEVNLIRDDAVRSAVADFLDLPEVRALKKWEDKLALLARTPIRVGSAQNKTRLRRVRIVIKNQSIQPIKSAPYKGYSTDSIAFCDIWYTPNLKRKGKANGHWNFVGTYVSYADAKAFENNEDALHLKYRPHPAARKVMRLFKNDMVMLTDVQGREQLTRVAGYSATANTLDVRNHTESGGKQNFKAIPVLMGKMIMRKVHVTVDGRILR